MKRQKTFAGELHSINFYGINVEEVPENIKAIIIGMFRQGCRPETISVVQKIPYIKVVAIIESRLDVFIEALN